MYCLYPKTNAHEIKQKAHFLFSSYWPLGKIQCLAVIFIGVFTSVQCFEKSSLSNIPYIQNFYIALQIKNFLKLLKFVRKKSQHAPSKSLISWLILKVKEFE